MKTAILNALRALGVSHYSITRTASSAAELFFIRKKLDVRRLKDVTEYAVTVYRDFEEGGVKYRGSSSVILFPGTSGCEIEVSLSDAYQSAAYIKNPYFELYQGKHEEPKEMPSGLSERSLAQNAHLMAETLFSEDTREDAWLNSAEIFAKRNEISITTSDGTDVSYVRYGVSGEFVAQAKEPQDVEQYFSFRYDDLETEALSEKVKKALSAVRDRAHATERPKAGTYDIVLSGEHVARLLSLYTNRADAAMIYPGYSDWVPGKNLQSEQCTGERLNLTLVPSAPYSEEGIPMTERRLLQNGTVECSFGSTRFCRYLGIEPTGEYGKVRLENGTVPFETMKQSALYPVSFSDFQMDPWSGHFGGEIRLAYLATENGIKLVTGGSINGSLLEKQRELTFSLERYRDANYEGPLAIRIPNVNVNGSEEK